MKNGQRSFTSEKWKVRLSYWTLNMVFHFEESHYIPLQMEIAIWLQTKYHKVFIELNISLRFRPLPLFTVFTTVHPYSLSLFTIHNKMAALSFVKYFWKWIPFSQYFSSSQTSCLLLKILSENLHLLRKCLIFLWSSSTS